MTEQGKLHLTSLGCAKNLVDSEMMLGALELDGYTAVQDPAEDDLVLEKLGQKVVVDSISLPFLSNAVIDFSEELIGARFTIENPNATSSCGCGTRFSM